MKRTEKTNFSPRELERRRDSPLNLVMGEQRPEQQPAHLQGESDDHPATGDEYTDNDQAGPSGSQQSIDDLEGSSGSQQSTDDEDGSSASQHTIGNQPRSSETQQVTDGTDDDSGASDASVQIVEEVGEVLPPQSSHESRLKTVVRAGLTVVLASMVDHPNYTAADGASVQTTMRNLDNGFWEFTDTSPQRGGPPRVNLEPSRRREGSSSPPNTVESTERPSRSDSPAPRSASSSRAATVYRPRAGWPIGMQSARVSVNPRTSRRRRPVVQPRGAAAAPGQCPAPPSSAVQPQLQATVPRRPARPCGLPRAPAAGSAFVRPQRGRRTSSPAPNAPRLSASYTNTLQEAQYRHFVRELHLQADEETLDDFRNHMAGHVSGLNVVQVPQDLSLRGDNQPEGHQPTSTVPPARPDSIRPAVNVVHPQQTPGRNGPMISWPNLGAIRRPNVSPNQVPLDGLTQTGRYPWRDPDPRQHVATVRPNQQVRLPQANPRNHMGLPQNVHQYVQQIPPGDGAGHHAPHLAAVNQMRLSPPWPHVVPSPIWTPPLYNQQNVPYMEAAPPLLQPAQLDPVDYSVASRNDYQGFWATGYVTTSPVTSHCFVHETQYRMPVGFMPNGCFGPLASAILIPCDCMDPMTFLLEAEINVGEFGSLIPPEGTLPVPGGVSSRRAPPEPPVYVHEEGSSDTVNDFIEEMLGYPNWNAGAEGWDEPAGLTRRREA